MKLGSHYPASLKSAPVWALWRIEGSNGSTTKVPYSARYNGRASSTNPDSWSSYDDVVMKYKSMPDFYSGLAVVVTDGLIFVDVDHCIDQDGEMSQAASDIVEHLHGQYTEISQSGTGIHILAKGTIPRSFKNSKNGVEMYSSARFCALTGNPLFIGEPYEDQSAVDYVFQTYKSPDKVLRPITHGVESLSKDDDWIIHHAKRHGHFDALYAGEWQSAGYGSQSEADLALCEILCFWTNRNAEQIDRLFRSSGLYRAKWQRQDYRDKTIMTAISYCNSTLSDYMKRNQDKTEEALFNRWEAL